MKKTILITGSTDGLGLETARALISDGHNVLLHGRSESKLERTKAELSASAASPKIEGFLADLSQFDEVEAMATAVTAKHEQVDVLINNAGVYLTPQTITEDVLDVRFAVNTIAPYLLTQRLLPALGTSGRVVNLSSAAQSPVDLNALAGPPPLSDAEAYAQSKLALTMWSRSLALTLEDHGPAIIAVNPGSMLATKMVRDAYGVAGADVRIGVDILVRAATSSEFATASGLYFDNDAGRFAPPHSDALDAEKCADVANAIEELLSPRSQTT